MRNTIPRPNYGHDISTLKHWSLCTLAGALPRPFFLIIKNSLSNQLYKTKGPSPFSLEKELSWAFGNERAPDP